MDKLNRMMEMVDNFNSLMADVEDATKENDKIARENSDEVFNIYLNKLIPYLEVASKLSLDMMVNQKIKDFATKYIGLNGKNNTIIVKTITGRFYLRYHGSSINSNGKYIWTKQYEDRTIRETLEFLDDTFGNGFEYFEKDFYNQIEKHMSDLTAKVDNEYQKSLAFKNMVDANRRG